MAGLAIMLAIPNEVLREIFLYLPILDRIRAREVCRQWRDVSDDCWREVRSLSVMVVEDHELVTTAVDALPIVHGDYKRITAKTNSETALRALMNLCAPYLREFTYDVAANFDITFVADAENVEKLDVIVNSDAAAYDVGHLLSINHNVKDLKIATYELLPCLLDVNPSSLEALDVSILDPYYSNIKYDASYHLSDTQFEFILGSVIKGATHLRKLKLGSIVDKKIFELVCTKVTLEHLTIDGPYEDRFFGLFSITKLCNLQTLKIYGVSLASLNNKFLIDVGKNCHKLRVIELRLCERITDKGLQALSRLLELKELVIADAPNVTGTCLPRLLSIESLKITGTGITNEAVVRILGKPSLLNSVELSGRKFEVEKLKESSRKIVEERGGLVPFDLYVNQKCILRKD